MKTFLKFMLIISVFNYSNECNSQNLERESVTVMLDLKPILQLEISSQDQIDFVFDKEKQYHDGIEKMQPLPSTLPLQLNGICMQLAELKKRTPMVKLIGIKKTSIILT